MNIDAVYKANNLNECFEYLEKGYSIISGGTDIVVRLNEGHIDHVKLLDISSVEELKGVSVDGDVITIGAATTFTEVIEQASVFPAHIHAFIESLKSVGSPQIRNAGTVGGNICNGSPAADSIPPLIALSAELHIDSKTESRTIKIDDFFLGKGKVALNEGEILKSIRFSIPKKGELKFYKYSFRNALSITLGSFAALIEKENNVINNIKIASGGFSAYCQREPEMEALFNGVKLEEAYSKIEQANKVVQDRISMFDDAFKEMKHVTLHGALKHVLKG